MPADRQANLLPPMTAASASDSRREDIRQIALDLFGRYGYERTSLRDIAERAGFTKAALYYHYPTKDALLNDLFAPVIGEGDEIVARHREVRTRAQREALLSEYFDHLWEHRLLLCHVACDLTVLSTTEVGARLVLHVDSLITAIAGSADVIPRTLAKAALGALQGTITLSEPDIDVSLTRTLAVKAALAAMQASKTVRQPSSGARPESS